MRRALTILAVAALASCGNGGASVSLVGSSFRAGRVGVGGLVRTSVALRDIDLAISISAGGKVIRTEPDTLLHCSPGRDCWWGTAFVHEGTVDDVTVRVVSSTSAGSDVNPVREIAATRRGGAVRLRLPREEGTVYLLAFERGRPRFGLSSFIDHGDREEQRYGPDVFPLRRGERVRAFFYPGRVPASVYGPVD